MIKGEDKEQELLKDILSGNVIAMKEFYTTYSGYLTTVCSRYISDKDDIKDVLQESFIKIFKAIANFEYKGFGSLKAWSTRIVVNESLKFLKTREKLEIINKPVWDLPDMTEDEDPDFDEIPTSVILGMIRSLPVGYRTVFNLYIFEKRSHKEIASILNITENTSASQLHRAKNLLVKQIGVYKSIKKAEL
ncbi:MAG: RNA polymerase sigma factor [Dysgonomonas sp.]